MRMHMQTIRIIDRLPVPALLLALSGAVMAAEPAPGVPTAPSPLDHALRTFTWGAYGEAHYTNNMGGGRDDQLDLHRFVLLGESHLTDRWRIATEIEIEHVFVRGGTSGATDQTAKGYLALEQGYLAGRFADHHEAKIGVMLVPISITNLYHEPTLFHGVERPFFDSRIVPSTWYDVGVGVGGRVVEGLTYEAAVQAGLNGNLMKGSNGFREGRQKGAESSAEDLMGTARLDWKPGHGLWLALAANYGGVDQMNSLEAELAPAGKKDDVTARLLVAEARWADYGWETGLSVAEGRISDPNALTTTEVLPEVFRGLSAFVAYDILRPLALDAPDQFFLFTRYEKIDNHQRVGQGKAVKDANNMDVQQVGVTWRPNTWVVVKGDYQKVVQDDGERKDALNLGAGFAF